MPTTDAGEQPGKDDVSGLVPELYYDLIARIAPGTLFILVLFYSSYEDITKAIGLKLTDFASLLVIIGIGYIAGHLLTMFSAMLNYFLWCSLILNLAKSRLTLTYPLKSNSALALFDELYERIDWVARKDRSGGVILKKMEAGAALADNILSGWIIIIILGFCLNLEWGSFNMRESGYLIYSMLVLFTLFLGSGSLIRRAILIARQDGLLKILGYKASESGERI
jgi:hypothetical protein